MSGIPDPASAFETADKQNATRDRNEAGQFVTGSKGGPGRRRGSRQKLAEQVYADTLASWERHGEIVLDRLAALDPVSYASFVAKLMPRELKIEHSTPVDGMTDDRLADMLAFAERMAEEMKAAGGPMIEGVAVQVRSALPPPIPDAPPTSAEQRAAAVRRDMEDQAEEARRRELF